MGSIKVSLNTSASPAVTLDPVKHEVTAGNDTIKWKESPTSPTKGFTFTSLTFVGNPTCFEDLDVGATEISVDDDNTGPNEYPYTIVVTYNGQQYSSSGQIGGNPGDPTINNK
jgi:hypothetical protein